LASFVSDFVLRISNLDPVRPVHRHKLRAGYFPVILSSSKDWTSWTSTRRLHQICHRV